MIIANTQSCECLDDSSIIKIYFEEKYRIFCEHCLNLYVKKYKYIVSRVNFLV